MNKKSSLIVIGWSFLFFFGLFLLVNSGLVDIRNSGLTGYVMVSAIAFAPLAVFYFKVFLPNSSLALMVHRSELESIASQHGWNFVSKAYPEAFWGSIKESISLSGIGLLSKKEKIRNALFDKEGDPVVLAVAKAPQNTSILNYQTCYYFLNARPSPVFRLRSEDNFSKLGQKLKSVIGIRDKDIDFEDDKDFSDAFVLEGNQEEQVRDLFSAKLRAFLLTHATSRNWVIESGDGATIFYKAGELARPKEIAQQRAECLMLHQAFENARENSPSIAEVAGNH